MFILIILNIILNNNFELIEDDHYPRQLYASTNPFEVLSRNHFINVYRLTKERVSEIIDIVRQHRSIPVRRSALDVWKESNYYNRKL